ncbi:MAG: GerMN domain-containing protein [Fimbriimonas sp.]
MLLAALGVGVFAAYVQLSPAAQRVPDSIRRPDKPSVEIRQKDPVASPTRPGPSVDVHTEQGFVVATLDGDKIKLVPLKPAAKGEKPIVYVANHTLQNLKVERARALSVEVKERVALIDFNPALTEGFGSMEEANLIKALQMSLGQFKEIDAFQIVIEGEVLDSLGHFEIDSPVPVIRPGKSEPDAGSSTTPSEDQASAASH